MERVRRVLVILTVVSELFFIVSSEQSCKYIIHVIFSISLDIIKVILTKIIVSFFTTRSPVFIAIFILSDHSHLSTVVAGRHH